MPKYVYDFSEGNKDLKDLLGGKGANLAEMTNLGIPVPPGFTITTEACTTFLTTGSEPPELADEVSAHLDAMEKAIGRRLGDPDDPLLVSVRSGAKFSMPGMMETVLNIGLNDSSVQGLVRQSGNERFAWDSYRRLVQMFGKTVLDIDGEHFEDAIDEAKQARGTQNDLDLDENDLRMLVDSFSRTIPQPYSGWPPLPAHCPRSSRWFPERAPCSSAPARRLWRRCAAACRRWSRRSSGSCASTAAGSSRRGRASR